MTPHIKPCFAERVLFEHYGVKLCLLLTKDFDSNFGVSNNSFTDVTICLGRYTLSVWRPHV